MNIPLAPDCYWVLPGQLLAGEYPGDYDEATARQKLGELLDAGIRTFVDLTEEGEHCAYEDWLASEASARGVSARYQRFPVVDLDVPSVARMREILTEIARALASDAPVYVHCWGGIGRTGTVVGCWLVERGHTGASALAEIEVLRASTERCRRPSPEMPEQLEFVRSWSAGRPRTSGKLMAAFAMMITVSALALAQAADPWKDADLVAPAALASTLAAAAPKPAIVYVGFKALYHPGHIPGATLHGPASTVQGLDDLKKWAEPLPRSTPVVVYCGCCPLVHCPNVRPAFSALKAMGFTSVRVLVLENSFGSDWVEKGYPVERQ
jgi:rhodanese-related sulfurtransferase